MNLENQSFLWEVDRNFLETKRKYQVLYSTKQDDREDLFPLKTAKGILAHRTCCSSLQLLDQRQFHQQSEGINVSVQAS